MMHDNECLSSVTSSPDEKKIFSGGWRLVTIWDSVTSECIKRLTVLPTVMMEKKLLVVFMKIIK